MKKIELLKENKEINDFTLSRASLLPEGLIYDLPENSNLFKVYKSLLSGHRDFYFVLEKVLNNLFEINADNYFLDEFLQKYNLPNVIFPEIKSKEQAIFAIQAMKLVPYLLSKEDFENFLSILGFQVKIYNSSVLREFLSFNYRFPISFSNSITSKDKTTFIVYVEQGDQNYQEFNNIGNAFPIQFVNIQNNLSKVKKILEFIKPLYIKFIFIDKTTKNLYNL